MMARIIQVIISGFMSAWFILLAVTAKEWWQFVILWAMLAAGFIILAEA